VSVVIPAYNRVDFLGRAIDSVLDQRYENVEAIVVDDGSSDGTADLAEERAALDPRVRVIRTPHLGVSAARNAGIRQVRGDYVAFLDADDWLSEDKLSLQVGALLAHPDVDLVYSDHQLVMESDGGVRDERRGHPPRPFPEILVYRNWFAIMAALARRALIDRVGGFDPTLHGGEDWDFWYRCALEGTFLYVPGVVGLYRQHGGQSHRNHAMMEEGRRRFSVKHFRDDRVRMRRCMSYYYLQDAKYRKGHHQWVACGIDLARYLWAARSPQEALFVWDLP
jgi:glycosyltransferase involved in cell wall biosynthesis